MSVPSRSTGLFPALLKYWRSKSGMSQLDLALTAEVSSRHVSFLETARAKPSSEMVLRLAAALRVPLRDQNAMLDAAGYEPAFEEPSATAELPGPIDRAIERMLAQQEPFPMVVMDHHYNVLRLNRAAQLVLGRMAADASALAGRFNAMHALFDPRLLRPYIVGWEPLAHTLVARMHREALHNPHDSELSALVAELLSYPGVPESWRQPDFSLPSEAAVHIQLKRDDFELRFLTTVTAFNAPQNIMLEELRIESYFPLDEQTEQACRKLAGS